MPNFLLFYGSRRADKTQALLSPTVRCIFVPTYGGIIARILNAFKLIIKCYFGANKPQLLLTDVGGPPLWFLLVIRTMTGIPLVLRLRGDMLEEDHRCHGRMWYYFDRWCLRRTDHLIPVCDFLARRLRKIGVPDENISVVNTPLILGGHEENAESEKNPRPDYLLMATNFHFEEKVKHIPYAIQQILEKDESLQFVVAGKGKYLERIREQIRPDILGRVHFLGFVPKNRLVSLYRQARLLVHVSELDAFPSVIQEALFFGVPVVALRTGGIPEMIAHGQNGFVCSGVEELCDCVINISQNDKRLRLMSVHAIESARKWQPSNLAPQFMRVLYACMAK